MKSFFITGGAGFIGSNLIRFLIEELGHRVLNLDKLTYAGNLQSISKVASSKRYHFVNGDVCDRFLVSKLFADFQPDVVMHLAAESHVDRSIDEPADFIETNIVGTYVMLESAREYCQEFSNNKSFRFHHISTDEVYGSLSDIGLFSENSSYNPSSPYSASKASSDHLVRAWHRTYGLPTVISNCSNNYGPYQFPEKLIPTVILNSIKGKPLPIYGSGHQIRDWLYVEDHVRALYEVATRGVIGETYNIGGHNEKSNLEVVQMLCELLDEACPNRPNGISNFSDLISFVADRPGHDKRYAIDASKIQKHLSWVPQETFETGLSKTLQWYLNNLSWCQHVQDGSYQGERLGLFEQKRGSKQ